MMASSTASLNRVLSPKNTDRHRATGIQERIRAGWSAEERARRSVLAKMMQESLLRLTLLDDYHPMADVPAA